MEMDFESWIHQRQPDVQFSNAESLKLPLDQTGIPCATPCTDAAPVSGASHTFGCPVVPNFKVGQLKEPHGWFYGLPRFRQGFTHETSLQNKCMPNVDFPGSAPALCSEYYGEANVSLTDAQPAPKQFLVFDRTGNKTTLMLSSMMGTSNQFFNSSNQKASCYYNGNKAELGDGSNGHFHSGIKLSDELDDFDKISEMHEDTEDINALLSSDDEDDYGDDGEATSTGRSPSTMTAYIKQDWEGESEDMDEVASSTGPLKRQKLSVCDYEVPSVTYTVSSFKPKGSLEYEDDAESSCAGSGPMRRGNICSLSGSKRERKEKIRETVSILQTILPGGNNDKDAVVVLDEAINYLKTLKFKAKTKGISGL